LESIRTNQIEQRKTPNYDERNIREKEEKRNVN